MNEFDFGFHVICLFVSLLKNKIKIDGTTDIFETINQENILEGNSWFGHGFFMFFSFFFVVVRFVGVTSVAERFFFVLL